MQTAAEPDAEALFGCNGSGGVSANGSSGSETSDTAAEQSWQWDESSDSLKAYGALWALLGLGMLPSLRGHSIVDLPYFIGLAAVTIYIGAHRGLNSKQRQTISLGQGALAPVFASVALFGAYLLIKYLPQFDLQTFFNCYFWLIGSIAVIGTLAAPLRQLASGFDGNVFKLSLPEWLAKDADGQPIREADLAFTDLVAVGVALVAASADVSANHQIFTLNNLLACAITTDILQLVGLKSFRVAGVMLIGLLLYDVFWVFGSPSAIGDNVMLTVATSDLFTGPTRLLFPRPPGGIGEAANFPFSLLGLGDIAVPGLLACLALRFDASRSADMMARAEAAGMALQSSLDALATDHEASKAAQVAAEDAYDRVADAQEAVLAGGGPSIPVTESVLRRRTYFSSVMVAYVAGLGMAFAANAITHLGQPALLYIVPFTLGAVALTAFARGETSQLLKFTDKSIMPGDKQRAEEQ